MLDSSNQKEFEDDNSKSDENGRKFSERVENSVSFSQSVFKKLVCRRVRTRACLGKG